MQRILTGFQEILRIGTVLQNEPMKKHTTFQIGGPADFFLIPGNDEELSALLKFCRAEQIPILIIGRGSNLLVRDKGIRGAVIQIGESFAYFAANGNQVNAGAGLSLIALSRKAAAEGLSGLEFAVGIPGTLGGAIVMNAGAYDGEMKDVVKNVAAMDSWGEKRVFTAPEADFGYRHSAFQKNGYIVLAVEMELAPGDKALIERKMADFTNRRVAKQPLSFPSAGSVFKRPPGHFAGPLIEKAGLKGMRIGGAEVSTLHAGWIINTGNATANDVLELIEVIRSRVLAQSGVLLEPELRIVGEE